jgi:hypothetical protein
MAGGELANLTNRKSSFRETERRAGLGVGKKRNPFLQ